MNTLQVRSVVAPSVLQEMHHPSLSFDAAFFGLTFLVPSSLECCMISFCVVKKQFRHRVGYVHIFSLNFVLSTQLIHYPFYVFPTLFNSSLHVTVSSFDRLFSKM